MKTNYQKLILASCLLTLVACAKKQEETASSSVDSVEASIESGVTMLQGVADDQSGNSYALKSEAPATVWQLLLKPEVAVAFSCGRAVDQACSGGVKTVSFAQCDLPNGRATLDGSITLTYSDAGCSLDALNSTVNRTYDLSLNGPRGGLLTLKSEMASDYRGGSAYGGGGKLTRTSSGFDLEILGRHSDISFRGRSLVDVSVRTLQPVAINQVLRNGRSMSGGQIEVNHNLAQFTAVFTPNNLQWNNTCCHPVSGTMDVVYSGTKTGTATVSFSNACGSATVVDQDGQSKEVTLSYCE